ncbi:MAG: hypothetical protein MO853_04445 [Candidatus Protistobacter heckmanni]|nr:hypothetical protein [Candidatus Protistobacter heckmanni]
MGELFDQRAVARNLRDSSLQALAITGSNYTSGRHITFYQPPTRWIPGCAASASPTRP